MRLGQVFWCYLFTFFYLRRLAYSFACLLALALSALSQLSRLLLTLCLWYAYASIWTFCSHSLNSSALRTLRDEVVDTHTSNWNTRTQRERCVQTHSWRNFCEWAKRGFAVLHLLAIHYLNVWFTSPKSFTWLFFIFTVLDGLDLVLFSLKLADIQIVSMHLVDRLLNN